MKVCWRGSVISIIVRSAAGEVAPASTGNDETAAKEVVVQKNTAKTAQQIAAVGVSVKESRLAVACGRGSRRAQPREFVACGRGAEHDILPRV